MHTPIPPLAKQTLDDEVATARLAGALARIAGPRDVIALWGDLGTGKTAFARAFIQSLSGGATEVPSPTFTLVQIYELDPTPVYHFDLYRLSGPDEAHELDIDDAFADAISLIEWPDRLDHLLPDHRLDLELRITEGDRREVTLSGDPTWAQRLAGLAENGGLP